MAPALPPTDPTPSDAPISATPATPATAEAAVDAWSEPVRARYRDNVARHLIGLARDLEQRALRHLEAERGHAGLRPSFASLIGFVALGTRSIGELASRLATSVQAVSQLVDLGERAGYVERRADPNDGRARVVALTDRGQRLVADAARILARIEADHRARLGATAFDRFREDLGALVRALVVPDRGSADPPRIGPSLGGLPLLSVHVQRALMERTAARGHAGLKMSHAQILPLIGPEGARLAGLARLQGVSRQAIGATARDLVGLGYLHREPDPRDGRGVVYRLSPEGEQLIADSVAAVDDLRNRFVEILGAERADAFARSARQLYEALDLEGEVFQGARHAGSGPAEAVSGTPIEALADQLIHSLGPDAARRLAARLLARADEPSRPKRRSSP